MTAHIDTSICYIFCTGSCILLRTLFMYGRCTMQGGMLCASSIFIVVLTTPYTLRTSLDHNKT